MAERVANAEKSRVARLKLPLSDDWREKLIAQTHAHVDAERKRLGLPAWDWSDEARQKRAEARAAKTAEKNRRNGMTMTKARLAKRAALRAAQC